MKTFSEIVWIALILSPVLFLVVMHFFGNAPVTETKPIFWYTELTLAAIFILALIVKIVLIFVKH